MREGHLFHGSAVNFSGKLYEFKHYSLTKQGVIDYEALELLVREWRPHMVVAGASAYSRETDFARIKAIIDSCSDNEYKPWFMVDMAHIAGLVAVGEHPSPFNYVDVITTTTHKTLRGPRGALIFCKPEYAKKVDSAVFPGTQGGPLQHVIAGKAICAEEALTPEYIKDVKENCKAMVNEFINMGYEVITGGHRQSFVLTVFEG